MQECTSDRNCVASATPFRYGNTMRLEDAFSAFRTMTEDAHRLEPDSRSYGLLISACARSLRVSFARLAIPLHNHAAHARAHVPTPAV